MDALLLLTSFLAGVLTILAPCVLPLLPVMVGGAASSRNRWQPLILSSSLVLSVILFTLLLKASTLLIEIPQAAWTGISGGILLLLGVFMLFPDLWEWLSVKFNLLGRSQKGLALAGASHSAWSGVLIGAALGPVFSSCSPTYLFLLATVLRDSFFAGLGYLLVYGMGLGLMLGLIAYFGQRLTLRLGWAASSRGWFRRSLGLLLMLVGLSIVTGAEKKIETALIDKGFGTTRLEERLLGRSTQSMPTPPSADSISVNNPLIPLGELHSPFPAPELQGLQNWLNSEPIASMQELKGKVVLVDFWTYSCVNCIRTLPYLQAWHERYAQDGLVILGIHAPEFQFEKKAENVRKAVRDFGLTYPVAQDNDFALWRAYANRYWPAKYLIDRDGTVRYAHFGEGEYEETEAIIASMLGSATKQGEVQAQSVDFARIGTHETYIGLDRRKNHVASGTELGKNQWTLEGEWEEDGEKATSRSPQASIRMNFTASKANLVMSGQGQAEVWIDGEKASMQNQGKDVSEGVLILGGERLYELADFRGEYATHTIEIRFAQPGAMLFAWTFG